MDTQNTPRWANAGPFSLFAVAVLVACLGGFRAGFVPVSSAPLMVGVLLACALPQLIGGVIAFRRGEILLGTISGLFGTTVTLGAALTLWIQVFAAPAPGAFTPELMGCFWIALFVITEIFAVGFGRMSWFLMLGIAEVGVVFLLEGLYALQGAPIGADGFVTLGLANLAGYLELGFAAFCIYAAAAILWGEHFERPVLPLGGPVFK
ncbi:MAG: acetate uptake transporter family protein [Deferrisomatales bacterium]